MKNLTLFFLFILIKPYLFSQSNISGIITDKKNKPIIGASISIKDSYDGASSDSSGKYTFTTLEKGTIILEIKAKNYNAQYRTISLPQNINNANFVLKEEINSLTAVTITAGILDQKKISVLNPIDIVTVAGSAGDISGALKTLPGTQQINDQQGLFVRGGTGYETQQFIDGALCRNAFLSGLPNLGTRGRFSPFLFKGTVFSPGGYSAMYGQALSGAIILNSIDLPEKSSANIVLSSVGLGVGFQELSKDKKFSWGINYNFTNLSAYFALVPQLFDYFKAPNYHSFDANFRYKTKLGVIKFYNTNMLGKVGIFYKDLNSYDFSSNTYSKKVGTDLDNKNNFNILSYKMNLKKDWTLDNVISYSINKDAYKIDTLPYTATNLSNTTLDITNINNFAQVRSVAEKAFSKKYTLRFGAEAQRSFDRNMIGSNILGFSTKYETSDLLMASFAEGDIYLSNRLGFKAGLRSEYSALLGKVNLAPRFSMAYSLGTLGDISAAMGRFYQKPEPRYLYYNNNMQYMYADHYILTYSKTTSDRTLRLEGFYKKYNHLVSYQNNYYGSQFFSSSMYNLGNAGYGYASGVELYFRDKKTFKGIDYWISYSYLNTKRKFNNYPILTQPDFAAKHTGSLVLKKYWQKINFGINASYTFSTGRPYFNPNIYYDANGQVVVNNFLKDYTPLYQSFNLSANYIRQFGKAFTVFFASLSNVLNQTQIYGYNYSYSLHTPTGELYRTPVYPGARQFVFIGCFISYGIDRSQDAINNNL